MCCSNCSDPHLQNLKGHLSTNLTFTIKQQSFNLRVITLLISCIFYTTCYSLEKSSGIKYEFVIDYLSVVWINVIMISQFIWDTEKYSKTCLKRTPAGPNILSALDRCLLAYNTLFLYIIIVYNRKRLVDQKINAPLYRNYITIILYFTDQHLAPFYRLFCKIDNL